MKLKEGRTVNTEITLNAGKEFIKNNPGATKLDCWERGAAFIVATVLTPNTKAATYNISELIKEINKHKK